MSPPDRARARSLAAEAVAAGEPTAWFEVLYQWARATGATIPWADGRPGPHVVAWLADHGDRVAAAARALVVGCGLGDDAEHLAGLGLDVVAFDVAPAAVARCRERFPGSSVDYVVADLLDPPAAWTGAFDLVVECYTLQVLPPGAVRTAAAARLGGLMAPGGTLLVVARGRDDDEPVDLDHMPWPLTRAEVDACAQVGVRRRHIADFMDDEVPPVRRFVASFEAPPAS